MEKVVEEIINNWDPIDLFPYSPKDEYKNEIALIIATLKETKDITDVALKIQKIFIKSFGDDVFKSDINECVSIAESIVKNI
jgi:hypothetical protein